jgi:Glycosyl transferase family 2
LAAVPLCRRLTLVNEPTGTSAVRSGLRRIDASLRFRVKKAARNPRLLSLLRRRSIRRGWSTAGDVTVVVVNWNTLPQLAVNLFALRRFSPPGTKFIVVDNGSDDGSRRFLRRQADVRTVNLPVNVEHGPAVDIGFLLARTEFVVALDVDAFPLGPTWLNELLKPLNDGAEVSGVHVHRAYAHPCCLAMRRRRFVEREHTFVAQWRPEGLGDTAWDAGELISMREQPNVHLFPPTSTIGPGWLGTAWEPIAFHNFYTTRYRFAFGTEDTDETIDGLSVKDAADAWDIAVQRYLGLDEPARRALLNGFGTPR